MAKELTHREHCRRIGRKGGEQTSERQSEARRRNVAKAREARLAKYAAKQVEETKVELPPLEIPPHLQTAYDRFVAAIGREPTPEELAVYE